MSGWASKWARLAHNGLGLPKSGENWFLKVPNLSHLVPNWGKKIWHPFSRESTNCQTVVPGCRSNSTKSRAFLKIQSIRTFGRGDKTDELMYLNARDFPKQFWRCLETNLQHCCCRKSDMSPKWVRLTSNGTRWAKMSWNLIWSEKVLALSHLELIWPTLGWNLTPC